MTTEAKANLIDWNAVRLRTGNPSKATVWRLRQRGEFPEPIRISPGRVAWSEADIDAWIETRAASSAA